MSLINCPECSREISDQIKACPHCGYPIKSIKNIFKPNTSLSPKTIIGLLIFVVVVNIIVAIFAYNTKQPSDISNHDYQIGLTMINVLDNYLDMEVDEPTTEDLIYPLYKKLNDQKFENGDSQYFKNNQLYMTRFKLINGFFYDDYDDILSVRNEIADLVNQKKR